MVITVGAFTVLPFSTVCGCNTLVLREVFLSNVTVQCVSGFSPSGGLLSAPQPANSGITITTASNKLQTTDVRLLSLLIMCFTPPKKL